jgi:hypothetical protein
MANLKDYATGLVATAPSPATTGTSLILQSGQGNLMPATPFYATVAPDGALPTLNTAEKVKVTNVSSDTLTIVRAQGDTSAQSIISGWRLSNTLFADDVFSRNYGDLSNKPTIPSNNNQLTNGEGYITSYTETDPVYSASEAANITSTDITNLSNLSGTNTGDQDLSGLQPKDADLTAIAGLNSATSGAIASDGSGWIKKTYAQLKTALGLTKSDVGLGNVTNDTQVKAVTSTDNALPRFDGTSGQVQNSGATLADNGDLEVAGDIYSGGSRVGLRTKAGVIDGNEFANSTVTVTGVGFKPKKINFLIQPAGNDNLLTYGTGFCDEALNQFSTAVAGDGGSFYRASSVTAAFFAISGSIEPYVRGVVTSLDSDGFTLDIGIYNGIGFDVAYIAEA